MKTKSLVLSGLTILMASTLVACSNTKSSDMKDTGNVQTAAKVTTKKNNTFKNNKLVTKDYDIKITKTAVVEIGEPGNTYGDTPVIAYWYTVTNKKAKDLDVTSAWTNVMSASQKVGKKSTKQLSIAELPDEQYADTQTQIVKVGSSAKMVVGYELQDTETPVKLTANTTTKTSIGSSSFKLK